MADWDEIKRLAADFQRTQTSDTLQKISERNCIDIVKKLTDLNLIELIYTCDGREFLTPEHLLKEIEDEIYVNGGRVHLHDLASNLNVDYQHVEDKAKQLVRDKSDQYNLVLGQIIHSTYKFNLGKQIYDTMIITGQLSIAEFSKTLDLPSEFLLEIVREILPQLLDDYVASPDERTYYTTDMMDRYKSIVSGTLSAITKPTSIASILKKTDITERMFIPIVESLIKEGRIDATIENRLFIPAVYAREQNEWIDKFYSTNSYIDYDVLSRKDIKQPKTFLKKRFPDGIPLKTCFVSPNLISQVESMIEDCIASNGLIDIATIVPASLQNGDIEQMLQDILKRVKQISSNCLILQQTNICSLGFIATCKQSFTELMSTKAKGHLKEGKLMNHFLGGRVKSQPRSRHQSENRKDENDQQHPQKEDAEPPKAASADERRALEDAKSPDSQTAGNTLEESTNKHINESIELTAEDLKRERRTKRGGKSRVDNSLGADDQDDSDEDQSGKKKSKSRKSGGGMQGREIKQKSIKKKYLAGKCKQQQQDSDDEQLASSKAPRSNKGRAAKRAISPSDRPPSSSLGSEQRGERFSRKSKGSTIKGNTSSASDNKGSDVTAKEPLEFMSIGELVEGLKTKSRDSGEFADEMMETIASMMLNELNEKYEQLARKVLDEHLRSTSGEATKRDDKNSCSDQTDAIEDLDELPEEEDIDFVE